MELKTPNFKLIDEKIAEFNKSSENLIVKLLQKEKEFATNQVTIQFDTQSKKSEEVKKPSKKILKNYHFLTVVMAVNLLITVGLIVGLIFAFRY